MFINYYKSYIRAISNSVGSKLFTEFYINEKDILNAGSVACGYYTSNLLKQFNLTPVGRANVPRIIEDLEKKGRINIDPSTPADEIPVGSIIVWETSLGDTYSRMHHHIGFYMGDEVCISNNSNGFQTDDGDGYVPVRHHYTYNQTRAITHILTRDFGNPFADWLYHHEIDTPHVYAVGDETLAKHGFTNEEIAFRSGKNEGLQYGKLCGPAVVMMATNYLSDNYEVAHTLAVKEKESHFTLRDCIGYAKDEVTYYDSKRDVEKTVTCYVAGIGRYHSGLIDIAKKLGQKTNTEISGSVHTIDHDSFIQLVQDSLKKNIAGEKNCIIASVTLGFDTTKEKKGGHLVLVAGLDYNGFEHSILVHDPIEKTKRQVPLMQFMESFSGNYIILQKKKE